jgi:hypothetical protein
VFGVARINAGEVVLNPPGDYVVGCRGPQADLTSWHQTKPAPCMLPCITAN